MCFCEKLFVLIMCYSRLLSLVHFSVTFEIDSVGTNAVNS